MVFFLLIKKERENEFSLETENEPNRENNEDEKYKNVEYLRKFNFIFERQKITIDKFNLDNRIKLVIEQIK